MNRPDFWKQELMRERSHLLRIIDEEGLDALVRGSVTVEKFAFVTAYVMRKLHEAVVLTMDVTDSRWPVLQFPLIKATPHRRWFEISEDGKSWRQPLEQHYDLDRPGEATLPFNDICNYLVHHFAFEVRQSPTGDRVEILFNSDRSKDRLFLMALNDYVDMVSEVAFDEVRWVDMNQGAGRVIQRRQRPSP